MFPPEQGKRLASPIVAGGSQVSSDRQGVEMQLTVLGCGDAFGSGGRLQTCFHLAARPTGDAMLIDCGATSLLGLERAQLDPDRVATIFITHLHGDHFGGLSWWLIHAQHVTKRTRPLTIAGPPGIEERFRAATAALYPGALEYRRSFALSFVELEAGRSVEVGAAAVTAFEVSHPSGAPSFALRFDVGIGDERRTVSFSGDTEWVEALVDVARGADLFITECYAFDAPVRYHLSWREIARELPRLAARRVLLTHMGPDMLANRATVSDPRVILAEDGMVIDLQG